MPSEVTQASTTNVPNEKADTEAITTGRCHASDLVLGNGVRLVLGSTLKIGRFTVTSLIEAYLQPNENLPKHRPSCMAPTVSNTTIISNSAVKGFPLLLKLKPPALAASMKFQKPKKKKRSNSASKEKKGGTQALSSAKQKKIFEFLAERQNRPTGVDVVRQRGM